MFTPSKEEVRRFFCRAYSAGAEPRLQLSPLEQIARYWILQHPEYHSYLQDEERACHVDFLPEEGATNPFLHLSMHLSLSEQIKVDQPRGISAVAQALQKGRDEHEAHHLMMDALAEMIWQAQRHGVALDENAYVAHLQSMART